MLLLRLLRLRRGTRLRMCRCGTTLRRRDRLLLLLLLLLLLRQLRLRRLSRLRTVFLLVIILLCDPLADGLRSQRRLHSGHRLHLHHRVRRRHCGVFKVPGRGRSRSILHSMPQSVFACGQAQVEVLT